MNELKPISKSRNALYKAVIILLVAVAAYSSAVKDLNRLHELAGGLHEITSAWFGGLPTVHTAAIPTGENSCLSGLPEISEFDEFRWSGRIASGSTTEIKRVNEDISVRLGNATWPDALGFKTTNGAIALDLPSTTSGEIEADTFKREISSDVPLSLLDRATRKHVSGRIVNGGRRLILKTLNGSISLRSSSRSYVELLSD